MRWTNLFRGLLMGICDLIPGVSGGTVAFMLGIYDELLASIGGIVSREWRRHLGFLLPLGIGIGVSLLAFSRGIDYLLEHHYVPTQMFFTGLIVGVLPMLLKQSDARRTFSTAHLAVLVAGAAAVAAMAFVNPRHSVDPVITLTAATAVQMFLSGAAASVAMLLPGISGSFVLLVLGVYPTAIHALATFNIPLIVITGAGVVGGLIVGSKLISRVLKRYPRFTYAAIIGLIIGSVVVVFPGVGTGAETAVGLIAGGVGFGLAAFFGARSV